MPGVPEDEGRGHALEGAAHGSVRQVEQREGRAPRLVGPTAGQAVVWYTGQFYALFFLDEDAEGRWRRRPIADGRRRSLIGTPFFVMFGWLSDKIGRKPIILARLPARRLDLFPDLQGASRISPIRRSKRPSRARPSPSSPIRPNARSSSTRSARRRSPPPAISPRRRWRRTSVAYANEAAPAGSMAKVKIGDKEFSDLQRRRHWPPTSSPRQTRRSGRRGQGRSDAGGYPAKADPTR